MIRPLAALVLAAATPAAAETPRFALPVACTLGETCHIQQYPDRDPGPGARDHTCGTLSYDGHKGTDFGLPSLAAQAAGVDVLAAAPGQVIAVRDGMPDVLQGEPDAPDVTGRECGNGVVIDHGDGWESQYCHMETGSIAVTPGERVATGATLGRIGLSGRTEFPHLHLAIRHDGAVIDPSAPGDLDTCGTQAEPLWDGAVPYVAGGILAAGWATAVPDYDAIKAGTAAETDIATDDPALVIWGFAYGGREGDRMRLSFDVPDGPGYDGGDTLPRDQAQFFRAGGRRTPDGGWRPGTYRGTVELLRAGKVVDTVTLSIDLG